MEGKTTEELRKMFHVENDMTAEEIEENEKKCAFLLASDS